MSLPPLLSSTSSSSLFITPSLFSPYKLTSFLSSPMTTTPTNIYMNRAETLSSTSTDSVGVNSLSTVVPSQQSLPSHPLASVHSNTRFNAGIVPDTVGIQAGSMSFPNPELTPVFFNASMQPMSSIPTPLALLPILTDTIPVADNSMRNQSTSGFSSNGPADRWQNPHTSESENKNPNKDHREDDYKDSNYHESNNHHCKTLLSHLSEENDEEDIKAKNHSDETDCFQISDQLDKQTLPEALSSYVATRTCEELIATSDINLELQIPIISRSQINHQIQMCKYILILLY
ncbi:unnamed protein product [Heterobilharzia americana]|nr:unnamed protein product [Heterobilharzia americana]